MITVSIVEDDRDVRESLAFLINGAKDFACISSFEDCETAIKGMVYDTPEVLLMDIQLPGMSGIEGVRKIRAWMPRIDIIMLTIREDDDAVFGSLCAGACGYITKKFKPGDILEAIKEIRAGGAPMSSQIARRVVQSFQATGHSILSQRETEVLNLLAKGYSYKMIAQALFISSTTVNSHLKSIYKKLEVHSEAQAIVEAVKRKLIIV